MKLKRKYDEMNIMKYCDLSSSEESKMRLIANLLTQTSEGLTPTDAAEIGHQIRRFLEKKTLLEYLLLGRTVSRHLMSKEQFVSEVAVLKKVILSEGLWN